MSVIREDDGSRTLTFPSNRLEQLSMLDKNHASRRDRRVLAESKHWIPMAPEEERPVQPHRLFVKTAAKLA